ncbi:MAG TPA: GNAT family N-acetyltransferase [Candidatus Atribacteria bacterium]|nr:GNAT family N-acetyltransferase [Candidatus Atribacteria bacterium]
MTETTIEKNLSHHRLKELIPELVSIYQRAYENLPEYREDSYWKIVAYLHWLWRGDPEGFLVAFEGDKPAGFSGMHTNWREGKEYLAEIHELVVDPQFQEKGIGKKLIEEATRIAISRGRKKIELWVGEKNYQAQEFYLHNGFQQRGQRGIWIRMIKELNL